MDEANGCISDPPLAVESGNDCGVDVAMILRRIESCPIFTVALRSSRQLRKTCSVSIDASWSKSEGMLTRARALRHSAVSSLGQAVQTARAWAMWIHHWKFSLQISKKC